MAPNPSWIEDTVDKITNAKVSLGEKPYYDLTPKRNPNDPLRPEKFIGAINPEEFRANLGFQGNPRATAMQGAPNEALAVSHGPSAAITNPVFAGPRTTMGLNPWAQPPSPDPNRRAINTTFMDQPGHIPFSPVNGVLPSGELTPQELRAGAIRTMGQGDQGGGFNPGPGYSMDAGGFWRRNPEAPVAPRPGAQAAPRAAIPQENEGATWNEPTRWDMSRLLANSGVPVPQMSREEMLAVLTLKPGQSGLANVGTMSDDQLRTQMDRKGMSYFKMSDADMRRSWLPLETDRAQNRPAALFTGGDQGAGPAAPTMEGTLNNVLQAINTYLRDPRSGPEQLHAAGGLLTQLIQGQEFAPNAAANRERLKAQTAHENAQAGAVPAAIKEKEAHEGYLNRHGKDAPLVLSPGQIALQQTGQSGAPMTEVGRGLTEKPGSPTTIQHMNDADKISLTAAWHGYNNAMTDEDRNKFQSIIDGINTKYSSQSQEKPPQPGAKKGADGNWYLPDPKRQGKYLRIDQ